MTLEGCVVRISDIIAYIGRDIEDAIRMGIINEEDIPSSVTTVLGTTNANIIDTIIKDLLNNSMDKDYLALSDDIFEAIKTLKKFNYEKIYSVANTPDNVLMYEEMFNTVFKKCLDDVKHNNITSDIYKIFLNSMDSKYIESTSDERKVIDYIAGMTDDFIFSQYKKCN